MTTPEQFERVERLFHELCELEPAQQETRLEAIAEEEAAVADQVRTLLAHHTNSEAQPIALPRPEHHTLIGTQIGPYRIDEMIGEGGMGVVYAASQEEPVRRKVALKLIRSGLDNREVVTRFDSERQALAMMSHPNIAQVLDAGTAPDGRPYFVMELVRGVSITEYCDARRLDTRARLDLFARICDAIQHAHQKGVIHRDIKPSNVIVSDESGEGVPKIIDFGVAKATDQHLFQRSIFTEVGQLVGTPEYMSPEQADLAHHDVDTRSDVYALGVLLYELLTGHSPFDLARLREAGLSAMLREIREVEPPRPSTRIRSQTDTSRDAASRRGTQPGTLARSLDGDLDWIVMRAMEKDRERRYSSVANFADDIQRYMNDEPVLAGPPSLTYRARKFVRRHRVLVGASAAVLAALILGFAGTTLALVRAVEAERVAAEERDNAEFRLNVAQSVSHFLVRLFESTDPTVNDPSQLTVKAVLERGVDRVDEDLADQPSVRADMLRTLGRVYAGMGHFRKARELLEQAVELRGGLDKPQLDDSIGDLNELAIVYRRLGEIDLAAETHTSALEMLERVGEDDSLAYAKHLNGVGIIQLRRRDYEAARDCLQRAVEIFARENDEAEWTALINLGIVQDAMGDHEAAVESLERTLERYESVNGPDHPRNASVLNSLANALVNAGNSERAAGLYGRAVEIWTKSLGPEHLMIARVNNNVGYMYHREKRYDEAIPAYRQALEIKEAIYGPDHAELMSALSNLGSCYVEAGNHEAAEIPILRARQIATSDTRVPKSQALTSFDVLGKLRLAQQRYGEAEIAFEQAVELSGELDGADAPRTGRLVRRLAEAVRGAGREIEADRLDAEADRILSAAEAPS